MDSSVSEIDGDESDMTSHSGDLEKSLLWADHNVAYRERIPRTHYSKKIPSLRLHLVVTVLNIALFVISGFMFWSSLGGKEIKLQDHWRATSSYCR